MSSPGIALRAWRAELTAHFEHPDVSNGPTENLNLKIKNTNPRSMRRARLVQKPPR